MNKIEYDVENCSENYKQYIRQANYGDTVSRTTNENVVFIFENKKYIVKFNLEFSFDFENGFNYIDFSNIKCNRVAPPFLMNEFISYINRFFVTSDRLSR